MMTASILMMETPLITWGTNIFETPSTAVQRDELEKFEKLADARPK